MKIIVRVILLFVALNVGHNKLYSTAYGSDSAVSIENPTNISGPDNIINSFAYLNNGFTYQDAATTCSYKSVFPVMGSISLNGGKLSLLGDLMLSNSFAIQSSGKFDMLGKAIVFGGNLAIPSGSTIIVSSNGVIDGQGNNFDLNIGSKLIIDSNITLTLRNLNLIGSAMPQIEMRSATSKLALQDVVIGLDRDFTFTQGQLFFVNDVIVTGSNKFSYASTETSYILAHSTLCFDKNTTFSYSPRLTGRHTLSEKGLIVMADKTSKIFFDECAIQLPDSGWKLTAGTIYFDNKVILNGSLTEAESFECGDGTLAGELDVNVLSGAYLENNGYINFNPAP